jgi:hypothetical protein
MKNYYSLTIFILIMTVLSACSVKSTSSKSSTTSTSGTSPVNGNGSSTTTGGIACDGINNTGATKCYFKNIPTIQVMGVSSANIGKTIWSSSNPQHLDTSIPQNQFTTDEVFNIRIVPRMAIKTNQAVNPSVPGKSCDHTKTNDIIASKLLVQLKLQTKEEDLAGLTSGEVATLSAGIDEASKVWHFSKRVTRSNLVLKVITVLSDSRCKQPNGAGYCPFADIPLSYPTQTYPTECVAFDIQFSTDETYDLPGASSN